MKTRGTKGERMKLENLKPLIESILEDHRHNQINLSSSCARANLASRISEAVLGKYYLVPYGSEGLK